MDLWDTHDSAVSLLETKCLIKYEASQADDMNDSKALF